jgi:hypothetical protein
MGMAAAMPEKVELAMNAKVALVRSILDNG